METARKGKVKWFDTRKGFGFITDDEGMDFFVHYTDIGGEGFKNIKEGDRVEFGVENAAKGDKAINVEKI